MGKSKEMEIAIQIAGKVESSFKNALGLAKKGIGGISKAAGMAARAAGTVTKITGAATAATVAAVGAIGKAAINTGEEFESSMSQVAATMLLDKSTQEGQQAFATLENAARECGRSTAFSATEAAEALNYLALAGYDADKAASALPTVLNLAGAGAMELAAASDMVTDSMSALKIEATEENLTEFSDKLAQTASKSNTSVAQLGEAILTVGGTASGLAGGVTELNTSLGILADNGIKAAEGGTHLRNMILNLQSPRNSDAANMFIQMGLSAYDAAGNMRSLGDIFGDINKSLAGASAKEVNKTLSTIFKLTDLSSARAMLAATADSAASLGSVMDAALEGSGKSLQSLGIDIEKMAKNFDTATTAEAFASEMTKKFGLDSEQAGILFNGLQSMVGGAGNRFEELSGYIEDSAGACEDMYAIQLDNLKGDISILKSALSDLGISIYKDLNAPLREMTQMGSGLVGRLSGAYSVGGMEAMASAAGSCLSDIVDTAAGYAPKITSMGVSLLENLVNGITGSSDGLAQAASGVFSAFMEGMFKIVPQVALSGTDIILKFAQGITGQIPQIVSSGAEALAGFINGITERLPEIGGTALRIAKTLVSSIKSNAPQLLPAAGNLVTTLFNGLVAALPALMQGGTIAIANLANGIAQQIPSLVQAAATIIQVLVSGIAANAPVLLSAAVRLIDGLTQGIISGLPKLIPAAMQAIVSFSGALRQGAGQLVDAGLRMVMAIAQSLIANIPVFIQTIPVIITDICGIINDNAPKLLIAGLQLIVQLANGLIQAAPVLISNIPQIIQAILSVFQAFNWMSLGRTIITGIANGVKSLVTAVPQALRGICESAKTAVHSINWAQLGTQVITFIINGIRAFATAIPGTLKNIAVTAVNWFKGINWLDVGISAIRGIIKGFASMGKSLWGAIKSLFKGGDDADVSDTGTAAAQSYADGISSGTGAASNAASGLSSAAFSSLDTSSATAAGTAAGGAFATGLTSSIASGSLDTSVFNSSMEAAGNNGAAALGNGINAGVAGITIDTAPFDTGLAEAGTQGAEALSNGMAANSQAVTQAAAGLGTEVNTTLDSSWNQVNAGAQTAMEKLKSTVTNAAKAAASAVRSAFANMQITIPKPKLPVISVNYKTETYGKGGDVKIPDFNVSWNAAGGIFTKPTIFNTRAGMQGAGEAGSEAILPLDTLWAHMKDIVSLSVREDSSASAIEMLLEKLKGIGTANGRNRQAQPAGNAGYSIQYSPVYNLYGNATKQDAVEAGHTSFSEFKKLMKQYDKELKRSRL